jgi:hypothetical protein
MTLHRIARSLATLALALLALAGCERDDPGASPPPNGPGLEIVEPQFPERPTDLDFGHLPLGEISSRTVRLRNASDSQLTIRDVQAGCTCARPTVSYVDPQSGQTVRGDPERRGHLLSIPAGVTADLELSVDTSLAIARNQGKLVIVRLTTDSSATPFLTLNVHLFVEAPFRPAPAVLDLRHVPVNGGGTGEIALAQDGTDGQRITTVLETPPGVEAEVVPERVGGVDLWVVKVRIPPPVPLGFREHVLKLGTTGPGGEGEGPPLSVTVRATGTADAAIDPPLVVLQVLEQGVPPQATARLVSRLSGHDLRVTAARAEGIEPGRIEVGFEPVSPDAEGRAGAWELALRAVGDLGPAPLSGALVVETDDEQVPRVQASWTYRP